MLGVSVLALLLEIGVLLLQDIFFPLELSLDLLDLFILVCLDEIVLFLQSISCLLNSLHLFLEPSLLRHHALRADLKSLIQGILFFLKSSDGSLQLIDGSGVGLLTLFQLLLELRL